MNATEIWTMVTAIATCALALFAVLAWHASRKTLDLMRSQETVTKESAQAQVDDQAWGRQVDALANYSTALLTLADLPAPLNINGGSRLIPAGYSIPPGMSSASEVDRIMTKVSAAGLIWHMQHARSSDSTGALKFLDDELLFMANSATYGHVKWSLVRGTAVTLLMRTADWQKDVSARQRISSEVDELAKALKADRANKYQKAAHPADDSTERQ